MSFFEELKRRNVFRVAVAYTVAAWVLLQVADLVLEAIEAPSWVLKALLLVVVLGFIAAIVVAWAYEMTPEGIRKESEVDRSRSITARTGRKLDRIIIGFLVVAVGVLLYRQTTLEAPSPSMDSQAEATITDAAPAETTADSPPDKSIAVLPFTTRSTSEDDRFFSDGMHDDLLTQLAKIGDLKVISRTSMMEYRDTTKNLRQIGQELGVANILEGAVQRVGGKVRINVQLIDADTDEHLWAETYDREMSLDNLLDIQSEMSRSIASAMQATLSPAAEAMLDQRLTDNLQALQAYRRAKAFSDVFIANNLDRAESELRHALELDPDFAAAWAHLAYVEMSRFWGVDYDEARRDKAREYIDNGRAIDPDLPELDIAEGYYHYWGYLDYPAALQVLEPVLEVYPGSFEVTEVLAYVNRRYGRLEKALDYMLRAYEISPRDHRVLYSLGETYAALGEWEKAEQFHDIMEAVAPGHPRGYQLKSVIQARRDQDYAAAARSLEMAAVDLNFYCGGIFQYYVMAGMYDRARNIESCENEGKRRTSALPIEMLRGLAYQYEGNAEQANPELARAVEILEEWIDEDPDYYFVYQALCIVQGALGDAEATDTACSDAESRYPDDAFDIQSLKREVAKGLAMGGLHDRSFALIEEFLSGGVRKNSVMAITDHPAFRPLHDDPRWQRLTDLKETNNP